MQNRYAGDIGDYGKIGLLSAVQRTGLTIGINWYKTEPTQLEYHQDGSFKQDDGKYQIPSKLAVCDPELVRTLLPLDRQGMRSVPDEPALHSVSGLSSSGVHPRPDFSH